MPRAFLLLLPLAFTPIALQSLQNRFWEYRLRMDFSQRLRLQRDLGETRWLAASAGAAEIPFRRTEREHDSRVVLVAEGLPESSVADFSLVGCLDRASGQIAVQRNFHAPPPELCGTEL